jgi:CHASE2 domain-containing sensor protein
VTAVARPILDRVTATVRKAFRHLPAAILITLGVFVLEHLGLLRFVDTLSLRGALASRAESVPDGATVGAAVGAGPVILAIGNEAYEGVFAQSSPLNRTTLAHIIAEVAARQPELIVVDLDLSPGPQPVGHGSGDDFLKKVLLDLAVAGITPVVLTTPFPVVTPQLLEVKRQWMSELCRAGLTFGYADVLLSQGYALRVDHQPPVLPRMAAQAAGYALPETEYERSLDPCDLAIQGPEAAVFLSSAFALDEAIDVGRFDRQLPLDPATLARTVANLRTISAPHDPQNYVGLRNKSVFIGGTFSTGDRFQTVLGNQPGVVLHAATFAALIDPPSRVRQWKAVLFDVFVGIVMASLFEWSWRLYESARQLPSARSIAPDSRWFRTRGHSCSTSYFSVLRFGPP